MTTTRLTLALFAVGSCCFLLEPAHSFSNRPLSGPSRPSFAIRAKKPKGFGTTTSETKQETVSKQEEETTQVAQPMPVVAPLNGGQRALAELRRQRAEQKDAELRQVRELIKADEQSQQGAAAIPEKVAQRMGARMLPFVGLPLFLGMGAFVVFWYYATYKDILFEPALVAASTIAILVVGLLGITYSVLSASWDPDREGTFIGADEFSKNVNSIKEGLGRSRDNVILREKMSSLGQDELSSALTDLERRDSSSEEKQKSLETKLRDELK